MTAAIAFDGVTKSYANNGATGDAAGGYRTLKGVSFTVRDREFLAIVGPSGSGKTTLLRLVNRLSDPSEGNVYVYGEDVRTLDPVALRRRIGYVFQDVGLFPHMTVAENIGITPRLLHWDETRIAARVDDLMALVRLDRDKHGDRFPHELSGGERQRVGVARAIAAKPQLILMDEPFGALDPLTRDALGRDCRRLHDELGLTTVMITHDMLEALLLADRIVVMRAGRLVADGTPAELASGNGHPFVQELMEAPRRQADRLRALIDSARPTRDG
jgi:osmoprotectant transport system ATP-binding protein